MSAHAKFGDQMSLARSAGATVITFSVASDDEVTYASGDLVYIVTPNNRLQANNMHWLFGILVIT